jgi:hypothetical protein
MPGSHTFHIGLSHSTKEPLFEGARLPLGLFRRLCTSKAQRCRASGPRQYRGPHSASLSEAHHDCVTCLGTLLLLQLYGTRRAQNVPDSGALRHVRGTGSVLVDVRGPRKRARRSHGSITGSIPIVPGPATTNKTVFDICTNLQLASTSPHSSTCAPSNMPARPRGCRSSQPARCT